MKNPVIQRMICEQYNKDHRDVEVEFIASVNGEEEFEVRISEPHLYQVLNVKIKVTDVNKTRFHTT